MTAINTDRIKLLEGLLREARDHITAKPWDDRSCLHARISVALGMDVEYKDQLVATGQWDDVGCQCKCGISNEPHGCPYREEIDQDYETHCTCCEACTRRCAEDI